MEKKDRKKLLVVFVTLFLLAVCKDIWDKKLMDGNTLERKENPQETDAVSLQFQIEDIEDVYDYLLEIEPMRATENQAKEFFLEAKEEIDATFYTGGDTFCTEDSYADGYVMAEWKISPSGYVDTEDQLRWEKIPEEGILFQVEANLSCGFYEEVYAFPIQVEPKAVSEIEKIRNQIEDDISEQMNAEGVGEIQLPQSVNGKEIRWKEKREYLSGKILLLELIVVVLLCVLQKKEEEDCKKERLKKLEYEYPNVVHQLCVLLGAGMTVRQAWMRIAKQYQEKRKKGVVQENVLYEAVVHMANRLAEGEMERVAYDKFVEEVNVPCFRRLMRSIVVHLEKGGMGMYQFLESEEKRAYELRILQAKKLGEEASTKMLVPLMIQMVLIMAVVLAPAMIGFWG